MRDEMDIIADLMEELKCAMEYGESDFDERLGRKKPDVGVLKIESEIEPELGGEMLGDDMGEDLEMEMGPEDKLKERLKKLRG